MALLRLFVCATGAILGSGHITAGTTFGPVVTGGETRPETVGFEASLPSRYDLHDYGWVTPVKSQTRDYPETGKPDHRRLRRYLLGIFIQDSFRN